MTITTGPNTLTLSGANNTYTGGTTLSADSAAILGHDGALGTGAVAMNDGSSLVFTGGVGIGHAITVTGDPDFSAAPATTSVISGAITGSGSVTINNTAGNTGTIEFTSTGNAYTGSTTVEAGELLGGVAGAFSAASATTVNSGAILDLGGFAQTINSVTLTGGTIQNGSLTGAISSAGGTVNGIGGARYDGLAHAHDDGGLQHLHRRDDGRQRRDALGRRRGQCVQRGERDDGEWHARPWRQRSDGEFARRRRHGDQQRRFGDRDPYQSRRVVGV